MQDKIREFIIALQHGQAVIFPTETVYALAADAQNAAAVEAIYRRKKRDKDKPMAVFTNNLEAAEILVHTTKEAHIIASHFMPGPLTLILPLKHNHGLPTCVNAGMESLGIRIPDHPFAMALLKQWNKPLVATSANISGAGAGTRAREIQHCFDELPLSHWDDTGVQGAASTVLDMTGAAPRILRQGPITLEQINQCLASNKPKHQ